VSESLPSWVIDAAQLPVAFAQVREDPELDQWVVGQVGGGARILMVASGGCTAAALAATSGVASLHLVDPNPAQIALARLKLHLLASASLDERLALLGHAPLNEAKRAIAVAAALASLELPAETLGPLKLVATVGPDHAGRYERLFAALRAALEAHADALAEVLTMNDPVAQACRVEPGTPLGRALDDAFERVLALPILVGLFGDGATRNPREPFASHFLRRARWAFAALPAATNPFLWQMLLGRFPPGCEHAWLRAPRQSTLPRVSWSIMPMMDALRTRAGDCDVVHLSNILDWLSPEAARATLDLAWGALREGGWVLVRQLNSTLDIPALGSRLRWQPEAGAALLARDRSFFYRAIHVGRRA